MRKNKKSQIINQKNSQKNSNYYTTLNNIAKDKINLKHSFQILFMNVFIERKKSQQNKDPRPPSP